MAAESKHVFKVGDRAIYDFGGDVEVEVIENRGPLGFRGRRLLTIRMPVRYSEPVEFAVAEAHLRPLEPATPRR